MATTLGRVSAYDLTVGVIVDMDNAVYLVSPTDSPLIAGTGADGLSVLSSGTTNEKKVEWMDETILTPSSTLAVNVVTADTVVTVASGDQGKFSTGDVLMFGAHKEYVRVTGYGTTADTLIVTRAFNTTPAATTHATSATILGVGLALVEGSDPELARSKDRDARYNYTQIFGPTSVSMSRTETRIGKYGVADEFNHQLMNRIAENVIAREQAILYGTRLDDTSNKWRTMGGLYYYINAQGTVDTTTTILTVLALQSNLQTCYNAGSVPDRGVANPSQLKNISDIGTLTPVAESRAVTERGRPAAQFVDTQFGRLTLVPDRWVIGSDFFGFSRENVRRRVLDSLQFEPLAKTGDSRKGQIVCEESLEVKGAQQMFIMTALT